MFLTNWENAIHFIDDTFLLNELIREEIEYIYIYM